MRLFEGGAGRFMVECPYSSQFDAAASMKLSAWARQNGITYRTAWNWFKAGKLPVRATQTPSGTILVQDAPEPAGAVLYARVSSAKDAPDLDRQLTLLRGYAAGHDLPVVRVETEVGSGLDAFRPGLLQLLQDSRCRVIVVENQSRLCSLDFDQLTAALAAAGRQVRVVRPQKSAGANASLARDVADLLRKVRSNLRRTPRAARSAADAL